MEHRRFDQIDQLFRQVLDLPEKERESFLKEVNLHDKEMFTEVMRLLQYADESQSFFGDTVSDFLAPLEPLLKGDEPSADFTFEEGTLVGSYRIKSLLGKGGMGQVYLAERDDGVFKKAVALKCLKKGMDSEEILRRFRFERQVLARLQHPNIATLLDGGLTEEGQPFFAMEYVEGLPINEYCDQKKLTVRERLRLFINVCDAVQYAHQQLVVHRDLKPSNILVTENGTVKLLDFGIARILDDKHAFLTTPVTQAGLQLLTPKYAAPEQTKSEQVSTATDIYTLGVLLLELLTGRVPPDVWKNPEQPSAMVLKSVGFDKQETHSDIIHHIAENRSATPKKLNRELKGDLDSILLTALREEPQERFKTVEMLKEDIQNYLNHLPVSARRGSTRYRIKKFLTRNKVTVAAATVVILLTVLFVITLSHQLKITTDERDRTEQALQRAEQERETAEEISSFLENLFSAANPMVATSDRIDTLSVMHLLVRGEERLYSEFEGRSEIRARMLVVMGRSYRGLGDTERATELFESALDIYRTSGIRNNEDMAKALTVLAAVYMDMGSNAEAEELLREAQELYGIIYTGDHQSTASNLSNIASSLQNQGKFGEALQFYDEALAMMQRMQIPDSLLYANLLNANTALAFRMNNFEKAEALTRESLSINRAILGDKHPRIGRELNNLAFLLERGGNTEEAIPVYREALGLNQTFLDEKHPFVISSMGNLAFALSNIGETAEAEELFSRAFELHRTSGRSENPDLAVMLGNYALMLTRIGRLKEAEQKYRNALDIERQLFGEGHFRTGIVLGRIGGVLCNSQRIDEGIKYLDDSLAVLRGHFEDDHPRIIDVLNAQKNCTDPG
jgi:eukaryotic-like serine/threonine-protein kinase